MIFSKGLKNEFETAVVNEPSVFEPLKVYCSLGKNKELTDHAKNIYKIYSHLLVTFQIYIGYNIYK